MKWYANAISSLEIEKAIIKHLESDGSNTVFERNPARAIDERMDTFEIDITVTPIRGE